jgi:RNA polymerase sigma factor (TIGR02999 family)
MPHSAHKTGSVTEALRNAVRGDRRDSDHLMDLVYKDLHQLARNKMAGLAPGQTLQTTALVHEAWMRISRPQRMDWDSRVHFFGAASRAMRNILVDQARRRGTLRRGGKHEDIEEGQLPAIEAPTDNMLALDESLGRLERLEPRKAQVVMLRFFTGLSMDAVAAVLGVSTATVERDWRFARAWLQDQVESRRGSKA